MKGRFFNYMRHTLTVLLFAAALLVGHHFSFYSHSATRPADCIVVFGAAVWPGYYGPVASNALADRTLSAARLYSSGLASCIILSGADSIYGAHEVDIMTDILLSAGVPESSIELDRDGSNTLKTIEHLSKDRSYILVSNDFHLARIGLLAQRSGLVENGFSLHAAEYASAGRYSKEPYFIFRELIAWVYYFVATIV